MYLADHDPLTGLPNRRRFTRELAQQLDFECRYGGGGALLTIDLDHLKLVNDTLGHSVGDELLRGCGRILRTHCRSGDLVGRLGGDEFSLTLPHADKAQAESWAREFLHSLENDHGLQARPLPRIGASIGIVAFGDIADASASDVQVCADLAMYQAKDADGDRIAHYSAALEQRVNGAAGAPEPPRLTWSARIRTALREDAFEVYAQPILDLSSDRMSQHELLLRPTLPDGESSCREPSSTQPSASA